MCKKQTVFLAKLLIFTSIVQAETIINLPSDSIFISTNKNSDDSIIITGIGPGTAGGGSGNPSPNWYLPGYIVSNNAILNQNHSMNLNAAYNAGILLYDTASANNLGTMVLNGTNNIGILMATGQGQVINTSSGIITLNNNSGRGIATRGYSGSNFSGEIRNDGVINALNGGTGIFAYGSGGKIINNGTIAMGAGTYTVGISISGNSLVENYGIISGAGSDTSTSNALIYATDRAQVTNKQQGQIIAENRTSGVYAQSGNQSTQRVQIINEGMIQADKGYGVYSLGSDITNNGIIQSNNVGVYLTKFSNMGYLSSTLVNNGTIIVKGGTRGIVLDTGIAENNGLIDIQGVNSTVVTMNGSGSYKAVFTNNADINVTADKTSVILVKASGSTAPGDETAVFKNNANISLLGNNSIITHLTNGARLLNTGSMTVHNGTGVYLQNASILQGDQQGDIIVTGSGTAILADTKAKIVHDGSIVLKSNGTGISAKSGTLATNSTSVNNLGSITFDDEGATGLYATDRMTTLMNSATLNSNQDNTTIIHVTNEALLDNSGNLTVFGEDSIGIKIDNGGHLNSQSGTIAVNNGVGISAVDAIIGSGTNTGNIEINGIGTGILSTHSEIINDGNIFLYHSGTGIHIKNNSKIEHKAIIEGIGSGTGIQTEESELINNGIIKSLAIGIAANNNIFTHNAGSIEAKEGVVISSGTQQYSSHFLNSGTIIGSDSAIYFYGNESNVLELRNGSIIKGKIEGSKNSDNVLIVSGSIQLDSVQDFNKLVANGNTSINGNIYLEPIQNNDYYINAYSNAKSLADINNETALGMLIINGAISVGVNYDDISNETDQTGKVIVGNFNVQNGRIILTNAGTTNKSLVEESRLNTLGDKIYIRSIVISNKQQAVSPDIKFDTSDGMIAPSGWLHETIPRIDNGVTVLDEVYTNIQDPNGNGGSNGGDEIPILLPEKRISVPRSRVNLDSINGLTQLSRRLLISESSYIPLGKLQYTIGYAGNKNHSKFRSSRTYNYDYKKKSTGINGAIIYKYSDSIIMGVSGNYTEYQLHYSNHDKEKIDSFNLNFFGRYQINSWHFSSHIGFGLNHHVLDIDWLGLGRQESKYRSKILNAGVELGYNHLFNENQFSLYPYVGLDYINLKEGRMRTPNMSEIKSVNAQGIVGRTGLMISQKYKRFSWNTNFEYRYNFIDTFHKDRSTNNRFVMSQLNYGKQTISAESNLSYKLNKHTRLSAGYRYEHNKNYRNHEICLELTLF